MKIIAWTLIFLVLTQCHSLDRYLHVQADIDGDGREDINLKIGDKNDEKCEPQQKDHVGGEGRGL